MSNFISHVLCKVPPCMIRSFSHRSARYSSLLSHVCYWEEVRPPCSTVRLHAGLHCRHNTTDVTSPDINKGFIKKFLKRLGWLDHSKSRLKMSGHLLYENVADRVPYHKFFRKFHLPDTFFSWFLITELHVWMIMVRVMNDGDQGRFLRNCVVEAMWQDVTTRAKKLGAANPSSVRNQVHELSQQFQAAIVSYDEGLLLDDKALAGALWRRFFQRICNNPEDIEVLVHFIRKQMSLLDNLPKEEILLGADIKWIDLDLQRSKT